MRKYIISFLSAVILAFSMSGVCAAAEETAQAATEQATAVTTSAESVTEEVSPDTSSREDEDDPFADADGWEIPTSFYIGGGVLGVFIIASIVVLIMGKPKEK